MGKHLDDNESNPSVRREIERIEDELAKLPGNPLGKARANIAEMDCFVKEKRGTKEYQDWQRENANRPIGDPNAETFLSYLGRKYPDTPDGKTARELERRYEENRRELYDKALPFAEQNTAIPQEAKRRADIAVDDASYTGGNCEALKKGPSVQKGSPPGKEAGFITKAPQMNMGA